MKTHLLFVEPAQYTLDLVKNVYNQDELTFLHSNSKAVSSGADVLENAYHCDKNGFFSNLKHFASLAQKNDLIISNGYNHWSFRVLFLISLFKKIYIGIESDTPYKETKGLKKIIKSIYLKTIFRKKTILGLSGGNGKHMDLFLKYGMNKERIFLLPMMIDNQKYYHQKKEQNDGILRFLYVGRLDPEKNIALLIDAFQNKFDQNDKVQLIIVGSGSCEEALKIKAKASGNISFKGKKFNEELIACYHQADILILPSLFEPWGLVVNEALCSELAVICSDAVGASDDLVKTPNSGWVFKSNQQLELENVLLYCKENVSEVAAKAHKGVTFMKQNWSYEKYKQQLQKVKEYVATH